MSHDCQDLRSRCRDGRRVTGLDQATQKRLQQQVESIAVESAEIVSGAEITDVWMHR